MTHHNGLVLSSQCDWAPLGTPLPHPLTTPLIPPTAGNSDMKENNVPLRPDLLARGSVERSHCDRAPLHLPLTAPLGSSHVRGSGAPFGRSPRHQNPLCVPLTVPLQTPLRMPMLINLSILLRRLNVEALLSDDRPESVLPRDIRRSDPSESHRHLPLANLDPSCRRWRCSTFLTNNNTMSGFVLQ